MEVVSGPDTLAAEDDDDGVGDGALQMSMDDLIGIR